MPVVVPAPTSVSFPREFSIRSLPMLWLRVFFVASLSPLPLASVITLGATTQVPDVSRFASRHLSIVFDRLTRLVK